MLASNGLIYGIPRDSDAVLIIDPDAMTADITTISGLDGSEKWLGGVLATNGKVVGMPFDSSHILIIDPETGTVDRSNLTVPGTANFKSAGGVLGPNDLIYALPFDATHVFVIDVGC